MKNQRLSNEEIMDFLDGTLSSQEAARIEAHLKTHAEDASLVAQLRFAASATSDLRASETIQASENFWPTLRVKLGPAPKRGPLSLLQKTFRETFGPFKSVHYSLGAVCAALILAFSLVLLQPEQTRQSVVADQLSAQDLAFVQQSTQRHQSYIKNAPVAGDVSSLETGAEADESEDVNP